MAKFLKSIFTNEKKKPSRLEGDGEGDKEDFSPPSDALQRKLSISRSGRMKQANKKRHELDMNLYGENIHHERPKNIEYHVNKAVDTDKRRRSSLDSDTEQKDKERSSVIERKGGAEVRTPEEEIESAFEIIDKIS